MKFFVFAATLVAFAAVGPAGAAPLPVQPDSVASEGIAAQVREHSMGHGRMREGNMRGMGHGGQMGGARHGNMRGMGHGGMRSGMGQRNRRGMNHGM